jgi:hypothetical protein
MPSVVYSPGEGLVQYPGSGFSVDGSTGIASSVCFAGFIPAAAPETVTASGPVSVLCHTSYVDVAAGSAALELGNGSAVGQLKRIMMVSDGRDATISVSRGNQLSQIVFTNAGDIAELIWTNVGWSLMSAHNVAIGNTLSPVVS